MTFSRPRSRYVRLVRAGLFLSLCAAWLFNCATAAFGQSSPGWPQWGQNPQHTGSVPVAGQTPQTKLADLVFDPFVSQETAESQGSLLMHYQAPLLGGSTVFMENKTGTYVPCNPPGSGQPFPCGPDDWNTEVWNESALQWQNGQLGQVWKFATDWTPVPNSGTSPSTHSLGGWEPLFQPALVGQYIYIPGAGGRIYQLSQSTGALLAQINPFTTFDPTIFVVSPLTADNAGDIFYHAIQLNVAWPWDVDVENAWLVKVKPDGTTTTVTYQSLMPGAPTTCLLTFSLNQLPWPPSPNAVPGSIACGSQRPPLNLAPAISADGTTLYTASRAHFTGRTATLLAVNTADLSLQWSSSLEGLLDDGCNILLPPNGQPGGCRSGATTGVDPTQNLPGGGILSDAASASPVVTPDGSILLGVNTAYNYGRGHLLKFSSLGQFLTSYDFGWDSTPAIYSQAGTYSIVLKDNHYDNGSYCQNQTYCPKAPPGPYYMTQLDSNLVPQWQYKDATINKQHPNGFEWCVNAPAVDVNGVVYGDNEDGNLYVIQQGGASVQKLFMERALDAGYTPVSIGNDGIIYPENAGHLIAAGNRFATATVISSSSQNPSTFGMPVTFTAQVTSAQGTPQGSVTFKRGSVGLGTAPLTAGSASYTTTPAQLAAGTQSITAVYGGDAVHAVSTSPVFLQKVNQAATTTTLSSKPNPSVVQQTVTFTATVTAAPGTPTGNVLFKTGSTVLGTVPLNNGTATLVTTFNQAGSYLVRAGFLGSSNYQSSFGGVTQVVQP